MPKLINIAGHKYGKWLVVRKTGRLWECLCDCGNTKLVLSQSLRSGLSTSCGCYQKAIAGSKPKNNAGEKIGSLLLIAPAGKGADKTISWKCICDCGKTCVKSYQQLNRGKHLNCGGLVHLNRKTKIAPPTPIPYPKEAGLIFGEYKARLSRFSKWGWAEDIAVEALIRAAYVIYWRRDQGFPMASEAAYVSKALAMVKIKHKKEQLGQIPSTMGKISIGSKMTDTTSPSTVAQAETQPNLILPACPTRPKSFRRC
jgi:hypothetical protein